jgi:hypothetical protein
MRQECDCGAKSGCPPTCCTSTTHHRSCPPIRHAQSSFRAMVLPFNRHSLELFIIKPAWSRVAEGTVYPFVVGCPPAHVTRMPFACPVQV